MGDWRRSKWGDEISLEYGKALRGYDPARGTYRVFGSNGPIGWTSEPLAAGPGVILGRKGACRGVEYSCDPFWVIDTAYYVVPKTDLDCRWLYYAIKHHRLGEIDDGSPIPSTTRSAVYVKDVQIPPLPIQRRIARILGTLDDKIELNRRMNRTLEKMAAAIFKSWFIDFDPVRRNAARDRNQPSPPSPLPVGEGWPTGRGEGSVEAFDAMFPDTFEDSDLGPIPKGWKVVPMKDLADVNARTIKKDYPHVRIRYVDISSVSQGSLDQTTTCDLADAPSRAKRLVQTGDTIWSCVRPNRKAYLYIDQPADNLVVSTGFAVLSPRIVPASYLHQWATTQAFVDYLTAYATGAAYPAVKADTFETAKMLLPGKGLLEAFHDLVGPLRTRIAHNQRQNRRLSGLRDTLLPKLVSGEIEIPATETGERRYK